MHHLILITDDAHEAPPGPLDMVLDDRVVSIYEVDPTFTIDPHFPPVQLTAGDVLMADVPAQRTMVRASFAGPPGPVISFLDWLNSNGRLTYEWDPEIAACDTPRRGPYRDPLTGWGSWVDVRKQCGYSFLDAKGCDGQDVYVVLVDEGIRSQALLDGAPAHFRSADFWDHKFHRQGPLGSGVELANRILKGFEGPIPDVPAPLSAGEGSHGTMMAFDTAILAPKAHIVDLPLLRLPSFPDLLSGVTAALDRLWQIVKEYETGGDTAPSIVINNSWQLVDPASYGAWDFSHPDSLFNYTIRKLSTAKIDVVFASGNCGNKGACKGHGRDTIYGANSLKEVLTVSAANVHGAFLTVSSRGRGWIHQKKPDVCSSSYFVGSGVDRFEGKRSGPKLDGGTSAACAVTSGLVAAVRSRWGRDKLGPITVGTEKQAQPGLFDYMRKSARAKNDKVFGVNHDADYGYGIVDVERLLADLERDYQ